MYENIELHDVDLERVHFDKLNDVIINFYIEFLKNEIRDDRFYFCNSYFCEKLESNMDNLYQWIKVKNLILRSNYYEKTTLSYFIFDYAFGNGGLCRRG